MRTHFRLSMILEGSTKKIWRQSIQNLSDLHRVEKEIAKIHTPTKKETETMKAYKKVAKATIATLEKRRDSQAKVETAGTEEGEGAGVRPDPESPRTTFRQREERRTDHQNFRDKIRISFAR